MIGEAEFQVTAKTGTDGIPTIRVTAVRAYGRRHVTTSEMVEDEKLLAAAAALFKKSIDAVSETLTKRSAADAVQAAHVAGQRGEDL